MEPVTELRTEPNPRWIRAQLDGVTVVDTTASVFVWEHPYYPVWYLPEQAVDAGFLEAADAAEATRRIDQLPGHVHIPFDRADSWFEEDVEVFVHPRSPEVRVDTLASSRHVQVGDDAPVHEDLVWGYRTPLPESSGIAGLVCFYTERVELTVDGVHVGRQESDR